MRQFILVRKPSFSNSILLLVLLLFLFARQTKAQPPIHTIQASLIAATTDLETSHGHSFGMAFEYQRKLTTLHIFGGFSFISSIHQANNPTSGDAALDGFLKSYVSFDTGIEYLVLNKYRNNIGFGIGPALRLRREVEPILSVEREVFGISEILVQNRYRNKLDFGIVAFLDYTHILVSNIQLGIRGKIGTYGVQNGVFSAEAGVGYNFN